MGGDEEASGPDPYAGLLELAQQVGGKIVEVRKVPTLQSWPVQPYKFKVERPDTLVLDQMVGVEAVKEGTEKGMRTYINGIG